ncbi:MAG: LCP family protein [Acidimicrobiia bacterium]
MNDDTRIDTVHRPAPARPVRRRRGRRWVIGILLTLVVATAGLLAALTLTEFRTGDTGPLPSLASAGEVYLIVGTDSRENLPDDLEGAFGDFAGSRADVIILTQVVDGRVQLLSIPRDLRVEIPGHGTNRVNAAYAFGGPDLLVATVTGATGIPISHYMEVEFGGFASIVDALGGIELDIPYPARDIKSGLEIEAGRQVVSGATALAYARSRSYEEYRDGSWVGTGGGDIVRTARQREVLLKIMDRATSPSGLVRSPGVLLAVTGDLTTDPSVTPLVLARTALGMRAAGVTDTVTLPVRGATEGGRSYVVRDEPAATAVLEAFLAGNPLSPEG